MKKFLIILLFVSCTDMYSSEKVKPESKRPTIDTSDSATIKKLSSDVKILASQQAISIRNDSIISAFLIAQKTIINTQGKQISSLLISRSASAANITTLLNYKTTTEKNIVNLMKKDSSLTAKDNALIKDTSSKGQLIRFLQGHVLNLQKLTVSQGTRIKTVEDSIKNLTKTFGTDFSLDAKKKVQISKEGIDRIKAAILKQGLKIDLEEEVIKVLETLQEKHK